MLGNRFTKLVVREDAVVGVIVEYVDSVRIGEAFERLLPLYRFVRRSRLLEVDVTETAEMVNEDGRCFVPKLRWGAAQLAYEARCSADELVDRYTLPWLSDRFRGFIL